MKKISITIVALVALAILGSFNTAEARGSSKKVVEKKTTVKVDGVKVTVKLTCSDNCNSAKKKFESTVKKAVAAAKKGEDFKMKASCSNTTWSIKISGKPKGNSSGGGNSNPGGSPGGGNPGGNTNNGGGNNGGGTGLTCVGSECKAGQSCVNGAPCQASANSCGLTTGTADCAAGICIPPSDALCEQACTGPDGVLVGPGESRVYYSSGEKCEYEARTCQVDGTLSGDSTNSLSKPRASCPAVGSAPVISKFKMVPNTVKKDNSCLMTWDVQNALNCTITGPGFGAGFDAYTGSSSMPTAPITFSSTYTISCSNAGGSVSKSAVCYMNPDITEH